MSRMDTTRQRCRAGSAKSGGNAEGNFGKRPFNRPCSCAASCRFAAGFSEAAVLLPAVCCFTGADAATVSWRPKFSVFPKSTGNHNNAEVGSRLHGEADHLPAVVFRKGQPRTPSRKQACSNPWRGHPAFLSASLNRNRWIMSARASMSRSSDTGASNSLI